MIRINNKRALIGNGRSNLDKTARKLALKAVEAALEAVDPIKVVRSKVTLENSTMKVDKHSFDLNKYKAVYVVGGGKAGGKMGEALESVLKDRISTGVVNVPRNSRPSETSKIEIRKASHPIPDRAGLEGAKEMTDLAARAGKDDLVICLISGGGSSLMPLPREKITLRDKQKVTEVLLKSGATIREINTVRKHISAFKGGWLAKRAYPATVINLMLSDVIGDPLEFIASGPTVPDSTTFGQSIEVLERYNLWHITPESIKDVLAKGRKGLLEETPKQGDKVFSEVHNFVIGNNRTATQAVCSELKTAGLNTMLLTSFLEGEARHVGTTLASIAQEIEISGNPLKKPCGIVAGGESTVAVVGKGEGGRNQEIALSAALKISGLEGFVICSLSTDGIDGPTDAAGALVDGQTVLRCHEKNLEPRDFLAKNDSYSLFSKLGDLITTGLTETNVNDISMILALH